MRQIDFEVCLFSSFLKYRYVSMIIQKHLKIANMFCGMGLFSYFCNRNRSAPQKGRMRTEHLDRSYPNLKTSEKV